MSFLHRFFAVLSGLFLLQLMLVGGGSPYAMQHDSTPSGTLGHATAMAGMMHQPSAQVASGVDDSSAPMPVDCNARGEHDGCRLPFAPGQCSTMAACDVSARPAPTAVAPTYMHAAARELPSPALVHSGPTFAPELPPPRA